MTREKQLKEALQNHVVALDDWLNLYASEFCDKVRVKEAYERIHRNGGHLAYIAKLQQAACEALAVPAPDAPANQVFEIDEDADDLSAPSEPSEIDCCSTCAGSDRSHPGFLVGTIDTPCTNSWHTPSKFPVEVNYRDGVTEHYPPIEPPMQLEKEDIDWMNAPLGPSTLPAPSAEDLERARKFREMQGIHFMDGEGEPRGINDDYFDRALAAEFTRVRAAESQCILDDPSVRLFGRSLHDVQTALYMMNDRFVNWEGRLAQARAEATKVAYRKVLQAAANNSDDGLVAWCNEQIAALGEGKE